MIKNILKSFSTKVIFYTRFIINLYLAIQIKISQFSLLRGYKTKFLQSDLLKLRMQFGIGLSITYFIFLKN